MNCELKPDENCCCALAKSQIRISLDNNHESMLFLELAITGRNLWL